MEECSADTCIHGTCVNGVCQCNTNYYGATCATFCDMHTTCNDHGVCSETDGECLCLYGWVDTSCDVPCTASANCSDHGVCDSFGDCLCYDGYDGDLCEEHNVGYSFLAVLLLLGNGVVGYLWYRSRNASVFERKVPQSFNPDQLAARRQREAEKAQAQAASHANANPLPSVTVTINSAEEKWVCPACTFSNPMSAKQCVVCTTKRGAVIDKAANADIFGDDEEEVSIKRTRKTKRETRRREPAKKIDATGVSSPKPAGGKKEEAASERLTEIPSDLELLPLDAKEAEVELFKDETMRITLILKKYADKHLMSCVCRFYAVEGEISNLALTYAAPKYIKVNTYPISSTTFSKEQPASQQLAFLLLEEKPLKIRISGTFSHDGKEMSVHTGSLMIM